MTRRDKLLAVETPSPRDNRSRNADEKRAYESFIEMAEQHYPHLKVNDRSREIKANGKATERPRGSSRGG